MKITSVFIFLLLVISCIPQEAVLETIEIENYSSYNTTELKSTIEVQAPTPKYDSIIHDVMDVIGITNSDIEIRSTTKFGAFSMITRNCKRRFFLYNDLFFDSVYDITQSYKSIKSICFHEIAHHLYLHPLKSKWEAHIHELEADRYSGFQMRLIGATLEESIASMEHFGNKKSTASHPEKSIRINEIKAGFFDASLRLFKDSTYFEIDSLIQIDLLIIALQEAEKTNKSLEEFNKDSFLSDTSFNFNQVFESPTYTLLGKILVINEKLEVIDLATSQIVGHVKTPYPNASFELLKFETSTYRIENGNIYSINKIGTKIKLGTKIN